VDPDARTVGLGVARADADADADINVDMVNAAAREANGAKVMSDDIA